MIDPGFHNNVADFLLVRCASEPLNEVLLPARYAKSGRGVVVGAAERVLDLAERDIVLSEFNRINQNLILLLTAPGGYDLRDAGNGEQAPARSGLPRHQPRIPRFLMMWIATRLRVARRRNVA